MYAKLIFRNAKRSAKDYLVYIITMTLCVMLFYAFLSISSSNYQPDIGSEYNVTMLGSGMKAAICGVTLLLLFLIRYVNSYMLRRKQKEFAVQSVMGMEQKTIGWLFFCGNLCHGGRGNRHWHFSWRYLLPVYHGDAPVLLRPGLQTVMDAVPGHGTADDLLFRIEPFRGGAFQCSHDTENQNY